MLFKRFGGGLDKEKLDDQRLHIIARWNKIESDSINLLKIKNNSQDQEKLAREKLLMKNDNEDIVIIRAIDE